MSLKTAYKIISKYKTFERYYEDKLTKKLLNIENVLWGFKKALNCFKYHVVYCPIEKRTRHLTDVLDGEEVYGIEYFGEVKDQESSIKIATGETPPY